MHQASDLRAVTWVLASLRASNVGWNAESRVTHPQRTRRVWGKAGGKNPPAPQHVGLSPWVSKEKSQRISTLGRVSASLARALRARGNAPRGPCRAELGQAPLKGRVLPKASRSAPDWQDAGPGVSARGQDARRQAACASQAPKGAVLLKSFPLEGKALMHELGPHLISICK